jgi:hypothetical protein
MNRSIIYVLIAVAAGCLFFFSMVFSEVALLNDMSTDIQQPEVYDVDSTMFDTLEKSFAAFDSLNSELEAAILSLDNDIADSNTTVMILEYQIDSVKSVLDRIIISLESPPTSDFE